MQALKSERKSFPVKAFIVKKGGGDKIPAQIKAYNATGGVSTYVYLRDEPDKLNFVQRFQLYHELGHSAKNSRFGNLGRETTVLSILLIVLFAIVMPVDLTPVSGMLLLTSIVVYIVVCYIGNLSKASILADEINADQFALVYFGMQERENLEDAARIYRNSNIKSDKLFSDNMLRERLRVFDDTLEKLINSSGLKIQIKPYYSQSALIYVIAITCLCIIGKIFSNLDVGILEQGIVAVSVMLTAFSTVMFFVYKNLLNGISNSTAK